MSDFLKTKCQNHHLNIYKYCPILLFRLIQDFHKNTLVFNWSNKTGSKKAKPEKVLPDPKKLYKIES